MAGLSQGSSPGECPSCLPRASTRGACCTTAGLLLIDGVGGAVIQQRRISGFSHQPGQGRGSPEPPKAFLELMAGCAACSVQQPGWGRTKLRRSTPLHWEISQNTQAAPAVLSKRLLHVTPCPISEGLPYHSAQEWARVQVTQVRSLFLTFTAFVTRSKLLHLSALPTCKMRTISPAPPRG